MTPEPTTKRARVLIADSLSDTGIDLLRSTPGIEVTVKTGMQPDELGRVLGEYDALIVRSATKVTADALVAPGRLRVIGRAGTGVDNIDLDAATRAGIVVVNTPGGNSVAAAELTMSLLLSMARNVSQANAELREGRWERKKYIGTEVAGKTLGIVGLGRIGREVARRAKSFRMDVVGYDPYVSEKVASDFGIRVVSFDELIALSDIVTLHMPVSSDTRHMVDASVLRRMKRGARIINCARGGLIDEAALADALDSGQIGGAALDVFEQEPPSDTRLIRHVNVVSTPHLGASTVEAQERVGTEIAEKIREFFQSGLILDAVNFPSINREEYASLGPLMGLAERLGSFSGQVVGGGFRSLELRALGSFGAHPLRPIVMAATKGLLTPVMGGGVSYVNSLSLAEERGITVGESRSNEPSPYAGLLRLTLETDKGKIALAGTLIGKDRPRLIEIDGVPIESFPDGHMLFLRNIDVPGVVGQIGSILGQARVNIAGIQLGRLDGGKDAVAIINIDHEVPADAMDRLRNIREIVSVVQAHVGQASS